MALPGVRNWGLRPDRGEGPSRASLLAESDIEMNDLIYVLVSLIVFAGLVAAIFGFERV
jgi:hypothetical protein